MVSSLEDLFAKSEVIVVGNRTEEFAKAVQAYGTKEHTVIDLVRITQASALPHVNYHW